MASNTYSIDETQVICYKSNFKLKTNCSIKLFSPHGHLFPFSFIFQSLDLIISSGIWVAGCSRLEFSVRVLGINFSFLHIDHGALAESLREMICAAEIWANLGLKARCQSKFRQTDLIDLSVDPLIFSLSPLTYVETEQFDSKIALSASLRPAEPPCGIPCASVEQLGLTLEFSRYEAQNLENGILSGRELFETLSTQDKHIPEPYRIPDLTLSLTQLHGINDCPEICRDHEEIQDIELLSLSEDDMYCLPSWGNNPLDVSPHRSTDERQTVCVGAASNSLGSNGEIDFRYILRLASAAMRSLFYNVGTEKASDIQLSNKTKGIKLCDISPALFSPGYSRVFSYHNSFLGHIAHISTKISRHIQTPRIKDKFDDLKRFSPEDFVGYELPSETIAPAAYMDLALAVKIRLWKALQAKFRNYVAVETPGQQDRTANYLDRSPDGSMRTGYDESLTADNDSSCQRLAFENLHDEIRDEMFEDIIDSSFMTEDYELIDHDAFDDLLRDENLTVETPVYLSHVNGQHNKYLNSTSGVELQNKLPKCTQNSFPESMEYSVNNRYSSVCKTPLDQVWDILDQGLYVHDESLLDDFPSDEGSQSLDLATYENFHYEMMMDD